MNKVAVDDTNYLNLALLSALMGGGLYAGARGLKDITREGSPPPTQKNELEVTLPSSRMPTHQMAMPKFAEDPTIGHALWENTKQYLYPTLVGGAGLYGGFKGTSALYDMYANHNIDVEKEKVKQEYLKSLQQANQKLGSVKTPLVDEFLLACIDKMGEEIPQPQAEGLSEYPKELWNGLKGWGHSLGLGAANQPITGMTGAGLGLALLGSAGATYYIANRMDQNREENKQRTTLPTEIRLNVQ